MEYRTDFSRPGYDLVDGFSSIPSSIAGDAMGRTRCTTASVSPVNRRIDSTAGTVLTVETPAGSNYAVHRALEHVEEGDVLVVDGEGGTSRALWGELMSRFAIRENLGAIVIDGAIRDIDAHLDLDLPVYCKGATPKGPTKIEQGAVGRAISCDGVSVSSGDIAVCDADGVAFVPSEEAPDVLDKCKEDLQKEQRWMDAADNSDKTTLEITALDAAE